MNYYRQPKNDIVINIFIHTNIVTDLINPKMLNYFKKIFLTFGKISHLRSMKYFSIIFKKTFLILLHYEKFCHYIL